MKTMGKRQKLSRRGFLAASSGAAVGVALVTSAGMVSSRSGAWAMEVTALKPETMATLIQFARDIYPHDQIADRYYAKAVKGHEEQAAKDEAHKAIIEEGIAELDRLAAEAGSTDGYRGLGWEADRTAILHSISTTPFFQTIRGNLVVSLYNQKEIWPLFGFEGESADKGGYITRGFDDIDWI
ncbi:twin-arginine translocation signal domain-containing protein [Denitrobaculum tricleocarpae]|uniref:Twin-arginine translocation signal domain-containing protein n=1 Tax=Denitrobaculum tricleocarpae TaxID=2591009 RepID=A0A545TQ73_9PROT|nr:twin-arginine translocation signal domain-containing protein [Denitrobaculum tricleocarpae]TQV79271.1 twin-arginine translocation signal domain-containing protein [Denitrobaculum tricleocarpae]